MYYNYSKDALCWNYNRKLNNLASLIKINVIDLHRWVMHCLWGYYNSSIITRRKCLALDFVPILERELNEFVQHWNSHHIRPSRKGNCIVEIPNDLYQMPIHYGLLVNAWPPNPGVYSINYLNTTGCSDYVKPVDAAIWTSAMMNEAQNAPAFFSDDFFGRCHTLIMEHGIYIVT